MNIDFDDIRSGESKRSSCPKCHRHNTFTLSREDIRFNQQQRNKTKGIQNDRTTTLSNLAYANICSDFLDTYCINNISIPVLYDPLERRVAFMIQKYGENVDAIGRALDVWRKPKWKRYSDIDSAIVVPFDAPPKPNLIIVEDIISAWKAVTYLKDTDAMPLLGTSLSTNNLNKIWDTYQNVTIALDKDATDKAIQMSRRIFVGVDKCKVVALELDIKDMAIEEIQNVGTSQGTMQQRNI